MALIPMNSVGGFSTGLTMTAVIDATGNITGVSGSFTGNFSGATGSFSRLLTASAGISAAGGTFSALTQFTSGLSGHINISSSNATGNMYLLMARGAGVTAVFMDNATTPLVYQPSAGNLGLKGITLVNGNDYLYITPTQITATNTVTPSSAYFYFIAEGGNYLQSPNLSQIGDVSQQNSSMVLAVDPSQRFMAFSDANLGTTFGFFGVNRNIIGDYAVDISSATGKGLQLTYNSINGAGVTRANFDVSSTGNLTIIPSGGLATVTGTLNVSAGVCAAGGTFSSLTQFTAGISAAGGVTFGGTVASDTGYRITSNAINAQTGTTYTFLSSDNGKVVTFNNGSTTTVTIPTGLPVGFNCTAIQLGAGQVGFTAASGVTMNAYASAYKISGQHGAAALVSYTTNIFNLSGTLSA